MVFFKGFLGFLGTFYWFVLVFTFVFVCVFLVFAFCLWDFVIVGQRKQTDSATHCSKYN